MTMTHDIESGELAMPSICPEGHVPSYVPIYPMGAHLNRMERAGDLLIQQGRATDAEVERSLAFTRRAHDLYVGRQEPDGAGSFVFAVPTRVTRANGHLYPSEITPFLPMVKNCSGREMLYLLDSMPPSVIESYAPDSKGRRGHVLFVPLFGDILGDMQRAPKRAFGDRRGEEIGNKIAGLIALTVINQAASFAKKRLGAEVMGLGAVLPALTDYGRRIRVKGLTTTTGHGGTVALIGDTVEKVIEDTGITNDRIGVIGGAGSIGRSSLALLLEKYPSTKFVVHDVRSMDRVMSSLSSTDRARVIVAGAMDGVFQEADVVVSAITSTVNFARDFPGIDLSRKIIIDDSQPGAFDRGEVESLGGKVVWVVGDDTSSDSTTTRVGGYLFGDHTGLMVNSNVWGCEAEAAAIARNRRYDLALRSAVTPQAARKIGGLLRSTGIGVAPFQSFGKPVDLPAVAR